MPISDSEKLIDYLGKKKQIKKKGLATSNRPKLERKLLLRFNGASNLSLTIIKIEIE